MWLQILDPFSAEKSGIGTRLVVTARVCPLKISYTKSGQMLWYPRNSKNKINVHIVSVIASIFNLSHKRYM